ncbi:MAG: DUF2336 domain-containing protein [Alphaproteobacteria bacterium]|nr:MAG: DUF2336 domain-containing protein [Alphaproteobacteria bacterium]
MNTISQEQAARLLDLAEKKSVEARQLLLENISDLFLSEEGRLTEHQRALMTDILTKLVGEFETVIRKDLAARLATMDNVPAELVKLLANDRIEIAAPILRQSGALRDVDLIEIVRNRSEEHRLCIAMREKLTEEVSDALVENGGTDVIEALLRNQDAKISQHAMEYLVAESRRIDRFQEPLLSRNDLPPVLAHRMFWWVSAALRKKILTDYSDLDQVAFDGAVQEAANKAIADHDERESVMARAKALVGRLAETGGLDTVFLTQALKQQKIPIFIAGIAQLARIDTGIAWRIFADAGGESFAVLCRAIDISKNDFVSLFLLMSEARGGTRVRSTNFVTSVVELFDSITRENAQAAVEFWRRDVAYQEALQGLREVG